MCGIVVSTRGVMRGGTVMSFIRKSNLRKFLKMLQAQNRAAYRLLVGTSVATVWIDLCTKADQSVLQTISVAQFVAQQHELPSKEVAFHIHYRVYRFTEESYPEHRPAGVGILTVSEHEALDFSFYPLLLAYLCYEHYSQYRSPWSLTLEVIHQYGLKRKDVMYLEPHIEACNQLLSKVLVSTKNL